MRLMQNKKLYDTAIIGSGPGGYVAALKLAQGGQKVALIERDKVGGICLNYGCIPTKNLIAQAKSTPHAAFSEMQKQKKGVVSSMRGGLEKIISANNIDIIRGNAAFISLNEVQVNDTIIQFKNALIATGSKPLNLKGVPCDGKKIHNSTTFLELEKLDENIGIVGGGYIGCEFASLLNRLKINVTIIEAYPRLLMSHGDKISSAISTNFKNKNIKFYNSCTVDKVAVEDNKVKLLLSSGETLIFDSILVAIGRGYESNQLNLKAADITADDQGRIVVDNYLQTKNPKVFAIGDIVGPICLAHMASYQGEIVASTILGYPKTFNCKAFPSVVFTFPEIASVGLSAEEALKSGIDVISATFPFKVLSRAFCDRKVEGFAEIVAEKKSGKIIGAHCMHEEACHIISEMNIAVQIGMTLEALVDVIHPHPTYSEIWREAALLALGKPLHFVVNHAKTT